MEKEDILKALDESLKKECNPYLYGGHSISEPCFHSEAWVTGGVGGGSCWDEGDSGDGTYVDPHYEKYEEDPKPITGLEVFLRDFCPDISLSQFNDLLCKVSTDSWSEYEYYGNYTNYQCQYITFKDIAEFLVSMKKPKLVKSYR